jgi:adenine-specific DNA-methyltransferase
VHWVAHNEEATSLDAAVTAVHAWNESKRQRLSREHIALAWERLQAQGWLPEPPREAAAAAPSPAKPAGKYDALDREALVRLLERRDAERQLGLVWERDELEADRADHRDYVALGLETSLSHGDGPWPNLIIEGDNLDALRALRMSHAGRIRCIYIDPPYNTGNRDFVYNDRFVDKTHRFRHSLWLEFMHKRLVLARELLAPDGVIFVSIDDNEVFRLGMLMDQIFGQRGRIATFVWQTDGNFDNQAKVKSCHEYVLMYSPDPAMFPAPPVVDPSIDPSSKLFRPEIRNTIVKNGPKNPVSQLRLPVGFPAQFESGTIDRRSDKWPRILSDVVVKDWRLVGEVVLESGWANSELCEEFIARSFKPITDSKGQQTVFVLTSTGTVENVKKRETPSHVISVLRNLGNTQSDGAELEGMGIDFSFPKPVTLIRYLISLCSDKNAVVLDFFAGSGTTAHAVAKLNAEDGGNRRFILVSSTEATDDQPDKNLCRDVCAERVRRVLGGYTNAKGEAVPGLGGSFAYLKARRVAPHRLSTRLHHAEIWSALQLLHDLPLSPWDGRSLAAAVDARSAVAYLPDMGHDSEGVVRAWHQAHAERARTLYSWTPDRVRAWAPGAQVSPIPESLRLRFGVRA